MAQKLVLVRIEITTKSRGNLVEIVEISANSGQIWGISLPCLRLALYQASVPVLSLSQAAKSAFIRLTCSILS